MFVVRDWISGHVTFIATQQKMPAAGQQRAQGNVCTAGALVYHLIFQTRL